MSQAAVSHTMWEADPITTEVEALFASIDSLDRRARFRRLHPLNDCYFCGGRGEIVELRLFRRVTFACPACNEDA